VVHRHVEQDFAVRDAEGEEAQQRSVDEVEGDVDRGLAGPLRLLPRSSSGTPRKSARRRAGSPAGATICTGSASTISKVVRRVWWRRMISRTVRTSTPGSSGPRTRRAVQT
jgi:hypothetical protein